MGKARSAFVLATLVGALVGGFILVINNFVLTCMVPVTTETTHSKTNQTGAGAQTSSLRNQNHDGAGNHGSAATPSATTTEEATHGLIESAHGEGRPGMKYNFTAAICTLVKDHEAYLMEWIDYNLLALEFDAIYLYDNSDDFDLQVWHDRTRSHPIYSRVHVVHQPGRKVKLPGKRQGQPVQYFVFDECVKRNGKLGAKHDFIALIDSDEFIVFQNNVSQTNQLEPIADEEPRSAPKDYDSIHALLQDYLVPYGGALVINWMYFGTSNRTLYAPVPITKRFQYRDSAPGGTIKSIVKSMDYEHCLNPHAVQVRQDKFIHDTSTKGGFPTELVRVAEEASWETQMRQSSKGVAHNRGAPSDVVLLHHYRFMTLKEFEKKMCHRGEAVGAHRLCNPDTKKLDIPDDLSQLPSNVPAHMIPRPGEVFDDSAWRFLTSKVPRYKTYDDEEWRDYM